MLSFLSKNYWWIALILLGIAITLDMNFDSLTTVETPKEIVDSEGNVQEYFILTIENQYQLIRALIYVLYSLATSLVILVALDKKIDLQENAKQRQEIEELNNKISDNVFDGVLKKMVPEPLFDQVKKDIFNNDTIRKNAKWTYLITLNDDKTINLDQTIEYELENIQDTRIDKEMPVGLNFSKAMVDVQVTSRNYKDSNGNWKEINADNNKVPLESRESKSIKVNVRSEYKSLEVMDSHVTKQSIIGLDIVIVKPEELEVEVQPSFTTELEAYRPNESTITFDKIPCVLLGQGIAFTITRKPEST